MKKSNNQVFYFTMRIAYPPKQILIFSLLRKAITTLRFRCKGLRLIELRLPVRLKAMSKQCIISDYYCCDNISQSGPILINLRKNNNRISTLSSVPQSAIHRWQFSLSCSTWTLSEPLLLSFTQLFVVVTID